MPGGAYDSVFYQNANHSVRVTDAFMHAALAGASWQTRSVTTGEVVDTLPARDVLREMAEATHVCGDPGIQYDTTINRWNPVKASGRIHSSNPCSEYMFLDDTACNLASLNLMRFLGAGRPLRGRGVPPRGGADDPRAGDPGRPRRLPDAADRAQQPPLPPARARLREPRRAADGVRPAVRQRCGAQPGGVDHRR